MKSLLVLLAAAAASLYAASADSIPEAVHQLDLLAAKQPPALAVQTRLLAAEALHANYPDLERDLEEESVRDLRNGKDWIVRAPAVPGLLRGLGTQRRGEAVALFADITGAFPFDRPAPDDAWWLLQCVAEVSAVAPPEAAAAIERLLPAIANPEWGQGTVAITARFRTGPEILETNNSRDSLLLAAALYLRALSPAAYERRRALFGPWDARIHGLTAAGALKAAQPVSMRYKGGAFRPAEAARQIQQQLPQMRGDLDRQARAQLAMRLAAGIRDLPADQQKLSLARALRNLSTEGDLGEQALQQVADTAALAMRQVPPAEDDYLELAKLIRYEHVAAPPGDDPSLAASFALLRLRELIEQGADFALTGIDGKTYSLHALRGHIVLLNFWATWCPPCRKEMPDLEKLYRQYRDAGLTVLAVSDEPRATVAPFIEKQGYTFPVLLDPDGKAHAAYSVEGIPKSFVIGRSGRLAAQAIDMRTEEQFRRLLREAGLAAGQRE